MTNQTSFWRNVSKADGCWEWLGTKKNGYGRYSNDLAHRVSYKLAYGEIPPDKPFVCHKCDNPGCVRPEHLFAGTAKDNQQDMIAKGRRVLAFGIKNGNGKLDDTAVVEMRRLREEGWQYRNLGERFKVHPMTAVKICLQMTRRPCG